MTRLDFIKEQIEWVDNQTTNMVAKLSESDWEVLPELKTSINWQLGHIIVSKYFMVMYCMLDRGDERIQAINKQIPLKEFMTYYAYGSNPLDEWENRPSGAQLIEYQKQVDAAAKAVLEDLPESKLDEAPEGKKPITKTKYETLTLCFTHQMWHNGQIALLKRILQEKKVEA